MAVLGTVTQQPADKIDYDFDYVELLETDSDTLATVSVAATPVGLTVSAGVKPSLQEVRLWVSGGVASTTYKVEITATSALGRIKQDELRVKIKEV